VDTPAPAPVETPAPAPVETPPAGEAPTPAQPAPPTVSPFSAEQQAAIDEQAAAFRRQSAVLDEPVARAQAEVDRRAARLQRVREAQTAARQRRVVTPEARQMLNDIEGSRSPLADLIRQARRAGHAEWEIADAALSRRIGQLERDLEPFERRLRDLQGQQAHLDGQAQRLEDLGKFKLPDRSGGSYRNVRGGATGGEVNHIPPQDAYIGEIGLSEGEGPSIWMTEEDHRRVLSTGSSNEAISHRAAQRDLIRQGRYADAVELDIRNIETTFPDGRYKPAIRQLRAYIESLDPTKLVPLSWR
jgi:hypothetical protein